MFSSLLCLSPLHGFGLATEQEIPSTGVECWYKLGGRSQRSTIQGRIHLKLWLSTREDLGTSEEDNWTEIKQQEKLHCVFIDFEVSRFKVSWTTFIKVTFGLAGHGNWE
jgi:BAI1-associated protein 3